MKGLFLLDSPTFTSLTKPFAALRLPGNVREAEGNERPDSIHIAHKSIRDTASQSSENIVKP